MWTTGRCRRCSAIGFIQPVPARSFLGLSRVCLNWHVGLKCKPTHGFIPWMSPFACSNLELLWLKSGANKRAPFGRNRKRGRGWPLFRLSPVGLEELLTVWTQTSTWGETFLQAELLPGGAQQTQTPWSCPFPRGPPSPFVQRKAGTPGWKQSCRKWGAGAFYSFPKSTAVLLHVLTYDTLARTVPFTTRGGRTWLQRRKWLMLKIE